MTSSIPTQKLAETTFILRGQKMAAAYLLLDPTAFTAATARLIAGNVGDYYTLMEELRDHHIPPIVFDALENRRTKARDLLTMGFLCLPPSDMISTPRFPAEYIDYLLPNLGLWYLQSNKYPIPTLEEYIEFARTLSEFAAGNAPDATSNHYSTLANKVEQLCQGLCLKCVKEGNTDLVSLCSNPAHCLTETAEIAPYGGVNEDDVSISPWDYID